MKRDGLERLAHFMGNGGRKFANQYKTLHMRKVRVVCFGLLAFGDVYARSDKAAKFAVRIVARDAPVLNPAVFAVVPAQPVFDFKRAPRIEGG
jgi:hypothetical protein